MVSTRSSGRFDGPDQCDRTGLQKVPQDKDTGAKSGVTSPAVSSDV